MYSKKYMYDCGQKSCIRLIENGYVQAFEEVLGLIQMYETVRKEAELGLDKTMPKDVKEEPDVLSHIENKLKEAEEATRKEAIEENFRLRMEMGEYFHGLDGYHWLAEYFYKSSQMHGLSVDVTLEIASLQQQALLEESRGNTDIALKHLEEALSLGGSSGGGHLCRIYQHMGIEYLEKDNTSKALKCFKKAARLAMKGNDLEHKATCQALLGKALMKFDKDESALKCFELYIEFSEESNDKYGMCQGYFAKSEIFKKSGDFENSITSLNQCQKLAKENNFDSPLIFSSISLGQIETAKRRYLAAEKHFEYAINKLRASSQDFSNKTALMKLTRVMLGIGKAHLSFNHLITALQSPRNQHLSKILGWRNTGGAFKGEIAERQDHLIDLQKMEAKEREAEISEFIDKLLALELNE